MTDHQCPKNAGKNSQQKANSHRQKAGQFQQEVAEELIKTNKNMQKANIAQPIGQTHNTGFDNDLFDQEASNEMLISNSREKSNTDYTLRDLNEESAAIRNARTNKKNPLKSE